MKQGNSVQKLC